MPKETKTNPIQLKASTKWRLRNPDYIKQYQEAHPDKRSSEYYREYYSRNKAHAKFRRECVRLRSINIF